jgi:RNA polymerase sigma-70 factor, ECF subfamily
VDHAKTAGVLYQRYHGALHAFCMRKMGDREEAADVVQEAFLNAWLALRGGFEPAAPYAWLLTIARNLCVSRYRAKGSRIQAIHLDEANDPAVAKEALTDDLIQLKSMLHLLPERQRRAFLLHEIKGLSYREVAADLELSYATVAALAFRTRRTLAQGLADRNVDDEKKPRRSLGLGSLLGMLEPVLGSGTSVKVATALSVTPLVLFPSSKLDRGPDGSSNRAGASAFVTFPAPLDRAAMVSLRVTRPKSPARPTQRPALPAAAAVRDSRASAAPANVRAKTEASPAPAPAPAPARVESDPRTSPISDTALPTSGSVPTLPTSSPLAEDATGVSVPPPGQGAGDRNPSSSAPAPPPVTGSQGQENGPPAGPGSQGNGSPPDPGSQSQGSGPPADPGSQGNGPPADPGSQGNGPPADPGSQGNGSPPDPGSQSQGSGPPADPGSQGNGSPAPPRMPDPPAPVPPVDGLPAGPGVELPG